MRAADLTREEEIRAYEVLDAAPLSALQRVADLTARAFGAASAEVNLITATEQHHIASTHGGTLVVPKEVSFCGQVIEHPADPYVVPDARRDPRFADNPFVTGQLGNIAFYAASRLTAPTGTVLGTLCVFDPEHREPSERDLALLAELAGTVVAILEMHRHQVELAGVLSRVADERRSLLTSNSDLEGFAGQVSHDLQGPLASVRLALDMLADGADDSDSDEADFLLARARNGAARMSNLIQDLMDFATLGGGRAPQPVDLGAVAADVVEDLAGVTHGARIDVGALPTVPGNEPQLRSVLQNLVANAVKFTAPVADPHVCIDAVTDAAHTRVQVTDNGPGVGAEDRERIFRRLARGTDEVEGHGIGLATCARIVAAHGGAIGVEDAPGGGSRFWFRLATVG